MSDIVQFPKPQLQIYICECGCSTFNLLSDGNVQCAACDLWKPDEGGWFNQVSDNRVALEGAGISLSPGAEFFAGVFGVDAATSLYGADSDAAAGDVLDPEMIAENPVLSNMTVAQAQAWANPRANGGETLSSGSKGSMALAGSVRTRLSEVLGNTDRGVRILGRRDRGGRSLWQGRAPAILTEPYFGSNPAECLTALMHMDEMAEAYYRGAVEFLAA